VRLTIRLRRCRPITRQNGRARLARKHTPPVQSLAFPVPAFCQQERNELGRKIRGTIKTGNGRNACIAAKTRP
jgi:hypothetical protein